MARLGVMAVLRDEQSTLDPWLRAFEEMERWCAAPIVYSFLENDSTDATPASLQAWMAQRPGSLMSERWGAPSLRQGRSAQRTIALAAARNQALERLLRHPVDCVAIVDGGLKIAAAQVFRLMQQLLSRPSAAMLAASAMQNVPDVLGEGPLSHYDSWALRDRWGRGGITFAENPLWQAIDRERWRAGLPVAVNSAFGGMAVVRRSALEASGARWEGERGCEHWAFCAQLRSVGSVLVDPLVRPLVWHADPPGWDLAYAHRIQEALQACR